MKNKPDARGLLKNYLKDAQLFGESDFLVSSALPEVKSATVKAQPPVAAPAAVRREPAAIPAPTSAARPASGKEDRLLALYAKYGNCQNCLLYQSRTKIVFGMGAINPKVLFIGEGPGYEEDRKGLPFVGKAGILLDKILASIGLNRENSYIANIVKCHPMKDPTQPDMRGNDRAPLPGEMMACKEILDQQIEILDPPVICALGATAARALLKTERGITSVRGTLFDYDVPSLGKKIPLLPTYHPAALLRNEDLKKDVWQDMKLLKKLISGPQ